MKRVQLPEDPTELAAYLMAKRKKMIETAAKWQKEHRSLCTERMRERRQKLKKKEDEAKMEDSL